MIALLGILLVLFVLFSSAVGGLLGSAIIVLSVVTALLLIALRSFFRPGVFRETMGVPIPLADPRSLFALAARTASSGEILVSYTRYRRVYRAIVVALGLLCTLLVGALVVGLFRAGYPRVGAPVGQG